MLLISSTRFGEHTPPPGHPERPERADVFSAVAAAWRDQGGRVVEPRRATDGELLRVHDAAHLQAMAATNGRAVKLDDDTFTSPESYEIALLAAGAAVQAADHALDTGETAIALVRPPGHHAERDTAMGFCLFNNVAVAAASALSRGLSRVAVVDIDVHHGNGTQWIFYADPRVLYISTHQFPFYPGTGAATEIGTGDGAGYTVNIPLGAGATDADYRLVTREVMQPVLEQFAPGLTIVSAGYDAHEDDPLASMRVTTEGFSGLVSVLASTAQRHGALALITEGGYDLRALEACLEASLLALHSDPAWPAPPNAPAPRGERALAAVRAAQAQYWKI